MKRWEELIRKKVFGLGGNQDHLPACLAHMMYCIVAEKQYNLAYFVAKRIEHAWATSKSNLPYGGNGLSRKKVRHNQAKTDKPEHENGKSVKRQSQKSNQIQSLRHKRSTPEWKMSKVKPKAYTEEILNGPPLPI
ncbi:hypothetical protein Tco_0355928 [Tanacetum coccineum]